MHARGYTYTNNNVITITDNGNTTQVSKSVGKDTSAVSVDVFPEPC